MEQVRGKKGGGNGYGDKGIVELDLSNGREADGGVRVRSK